MLKTGILEKVEDIIEITKIRKVGGFLITMDIEKAFDLLDHNYLISFLEKYGFGRNFGQNLMD